MSTIDFTYRSIQRDIMNSYTVGDFDNSLGQLDISLEIFDHLYKKRGIKCLLDRKRLLIDIQMRVDQQVSKAMYGGN